MTVRCCAAFWVKPQQTVNTKFGGFYFFLIEARDEHNKIEGFASSSERSE